MEQSLFYPGPTNDKLNISSLPYHFTMTISDMTGRYIAASASGREIDVSALLAGIYFFYIQNPYGSITKKFVKD